MQMLVYIHHHGGLESGVKSTGVLRGEAPVPDELHGVAPMSSFARVWVDVLAPNPTAQIARAFRELYSSWSPEHGELAQHMNEFCSLEFTPEAGFEGMAVAQALVDLLDAIPQEAAEPLVERSA